MTLLYRSKAKTLVAVVHMFDQMYGTMHDNGDYVESSYQMMTGDKLSVRMNVLGNLVGYSHDPCFWLKSTYYEEKVKGKKVAMAWNGYQVGDSWILRFVAADLPATPIIDAYEPLPLLDSLDRNSHRGPVMGLLNLGDETNFKPTLELLQMSNARIESCGCFMWIRKRGTKQVLLPKDFVKTVALKMVGVPRDKAGLRLCINTAKKLASSAKMSIPVEMQLTCAVYGAAMAFVYTLNDEIIAFNRLCTPRMHRLYRALADSLSLEWTSLICCGSTSASYETAAAYNLDRSSVPAPSFNAAKAWPRGLPGYESPMPLAAMKVSSKISNAERIEVDEDRPQFHPVAITFSSYIPLVPYASKNNEVVAMVNRALVATPKPDMQAWEEVYELTKELTHDFEDLTGDLENDFLAWNIRFPKDKRARHQKAWESLEEKDLCQEDFQRSLFVKRELTMKGGESCQDFDPRAIQAGTDRLSVSYGPFMHKFSKQLAKKWNADNKICYTSGMTAEEIGEWRATYGDRDVTIVECDASRYDSCQGEGCYENGARVYERCGINEYGNAAFAMTSMKRAFGYTGKGAKYTVDYTMTSGSADTSARNSLNNGATMEWCMRKFMEIVRCEYKMLVHGDDNMLVIEGHLSSKHREVLGKLLRTAFLTLGFNAKVKVSTEWYDVEYCSSLFWPVEDSYVLGPKLGKRLPKLGFSLRKLDAGEVKGMLHGLQIEAGFIGVFAEYARICLSKIPHVKVKKFADQRIIYKSMAVRKHKPNVDTEVFFLERYGVSMEEAVASLRDACYNSSLTQCVDYRLLTVFTAVDL
jgi:hypothetical protein